MKQAHPGPTERVRAKKREAMHRALLAGLPIGKRRRLVSALGLQKRRKTK
jgi:hypothetical protein